MAVCQLFQMHVFVDHVANISKLIIDDQLENVVHNINYVSFCNPFLSVNVIFNNTNFNF